uniref:Distal membrane-arm assembly complex protein 2 n=1 Tax=Pavo cristatus TaxID=9049 RepID=A0A8C9FNS3_PAVCR
MAAALAMRGLRGGRVPLPPHPTGPRRGAASGALQRLGEWFYEVEAVLRWAERRRLRRLRRKNAHYSFIQSLHGDNVAAACFAMSCGGRVRFEGQERWLCADTRGRWSPEVLQFRHTPVVAVDLSGSQLTYDGLDNLVPLTKLQHLDLSGCPHVDDWALGRLHVFGGSLQELSVARCPRVTERGLATLHQLPKLQCLDVGGLAVPSPGLLRILLEEMLPHCRVLGMEMGEGDPPETPPELGQPPPTPVTVL